MHTAQGNRMGNCLATPGALTNGERAPHNASALIEFCATYIVGLVTMTCGIK